MATDTTVPQHVTALQQANKIRLERAVVKRDIRERRVLISAVILDTPPCMETIEVLELLMAQMRWGRKRSLCALVKVPVSETKRLGECTDRQRLALVTAVSGG